MICIGKRWKTSLILLLIKYHLVLAYAFFTVIHQCLEIFKEPFTSNQLYFHFSIQQRKFRKWSLRIRPACTKVVAYLRKSEYSIWKIMTDIFSSESCWSFFRVTEIILFWSTNLNIAMLILLVFLTASSNYMLEILIKGMLSDSECPH